jgi:hypothetical protein
VPGLRFVDAANGVLGMEWVNGKSVRFLLGSGDEGEDADGDEDVVDDPLIEYGMSKGKISHDVHFRTPVFSWDENRNIDDCGRHRDRKDAPRGYHTWRPDNIEHDAPSPIFYP